MTKWADDETSVLELHLTLSRFLGLLDPIARALTCLESPHSSLADVLLFWLAVAGALDDYLRKTQLSSGTKLNGPSDPYLTALFFHYGITPIHL